MPHSVGSLQVRYPVDFADKVRKELESKPQEHLRRDGIYNVTVRLDRNGQAAFSGSSVDLKKVEPSLQKWR
jgi:hypothetical protein